MPKQNIAIMANEIAKLDRILARVADGEGEESACAAEGMSLDIFKLIRKDCEKNAIAEKNKELKDSRWKRDFLYALYRASVNPLPNFDEAFAWMLSVIEPTRASILDKYYRQGKTLEALSIEFGVSKERVRVSRDAVLNQVRNLPGARYAFRLGCIPTEKDLREPLEIPLSRINLSPRASNCLYRHNILTIRDLSKLKKADLMKYRNIGKKSADEIIRAAKAYGITID